MLFCSKIAVLGIFVFLICVKQFPCFKISVPSVLLAYNRGLPSNYTLEISNRNNEETCVSWHSANPQIVVVTPVFFKSNCSKKVVVSSVANLFERKVTPVIATLEGKNYHQLYCDVITDEVASIQLSSLTDKLNLGGSPTVLTVTAKDKTGHSFTSINGLEIQWKVSHCSDAEELSCEEIIRLSKFEESDYVGTEGQNEWERRGLFGASVLVEPVQMGTVCISASLLQPATPKLETQEIQLKVISNLKVSPSQTINILQYTSVNIRIEKQKKGITEELEMKDFNTHVDDSNIVSFSDNFTQVTGNKYGSATASFEKINQERSYPKIDLSINVVKLSRIGFRVSGGGYRNLEEMKVYEVHLDLYDENDQKIYPSDNLRFSTSFPTKLFHVILVSANGTYAVVQTIAPGSGSIRVEFKGIEQTDGSIYKEDKISSSLNVKVYQKLHIFPPQTLLPVQKHDGSTNEVNLMVSGGTGDYVWTLSNYTLGKLIPDEEKKNKVKLLVYGEADLIVTAIDRNNINFIATAKVSVQEPLDVEAYPTVVEAEVGQVMIIPVALLGYEDKERNIVRKFDDCSKAELSIEIIEKNVLSYEEESDIPAFGKGCISVQFRCKSPGYSRVNIEYTAIVDNSNITHKTTTILSCYLKLTPVHPIRVAVVALGTSKDVAFSGGPKRWPLFKNGYYSDMEASNPDIMKIELIKDPVRYNKELTVFRVTCKDIGENTLLLKIGNHPSATLQHPAKSEASIKFFCSKPHSVHLQVYRKKPSKKLSEKNIVKVPFYGEKKFQVDIWIKDSMGRKFANISSLRVAWDVSNKALAQPETYFDFMTHENAVLGYRKLSRNFKEFKMTGATGDLRVDAKVTSYDKNVLKKEDIKTYKELKEISKSIDLKLVSLRDLNLYQEQDACENDSCER